MFLLRTFSSCRKKCIYEQYIAVMTDERLYCLGKAIGKNNLLGFSNTAEQ